MRGESESAEVHLEVPRHVERETKAPMTHLVNTGLFGFPSDPWAVPVLNRVN